MRRPLHSGGGGGGTATASSLTGDAASTTRAVMSGGENSWMNGGFTDHRRTIGPMDQVPRWPGAGRPAVLASAPNHVCGVTINPGSDATLTATHNAPTLGRVGQTAGNHEPVQGTTGMEGGATAIARPEPVSIRTVRSGISDTPWVRSLSRRQPGTPASDTGINGDKVEKKESRNSVRAPHECATPRTERIKLVSSGR